jgi:putative glutamine amidotransferase
VKGRTIRRTPIVGILCCTNTVVGEPAQTVVERYVRAVMTHLEADAVLIPTLLEQRRIASLLSRLDGVVLTGSPSNVDGSLYNAAQFEGPFDHARDRAALDTVAFAKDANLPVLGICRGLEEINVAFGGTLRSGLAGAGREIVHHAPPSATGLAQFDWIHDVEIVEGGLFYQALGRRSARVNSVHYQGIERLSDALRIEAQASDGIIEAISARDHPIFAVQWHPELNAKDPASKAVFSIFDGLIKQRTRIGSHGNTP